MISIHILIAMLLILGAVLVPLVYFKKTKHISLLVFLLGGVGFYLSSQVLENILHRSSLAKLLLEGRPEFEAGGSAP